MKLATQSAWMPASEYGRKLRGLGINLIVRDVSKALRFQSEVLAADILYSDPDFAAMRAFDSEWMVHADHTYDRHPINGILSECPERGIGIEIRLYGRDPDEAESVAQALGFEVLASASDKPHGLRETYIFDQDGYLWVPGVPLP